MIQWITTSDYAEDKLQELTSQGIDLLTAKLLLSRDINTFDKARAYFNPDIIKLHDPYLMKDMGKAIQLISQKIQDKKRIMIYGDYDVDGVTSVALLYTYIQSIGGNSITYIPDRYTEGYGLSLKGIDVAKDEQIDLIITIDCGIRAVEQIEYANSLDIDVIICDHHFAGEELPNAKAILNPKQENCPYPYKELCACAVGFKLIQAMQAHMGKPIEEIYSYLDLVAIATAADIVPITGENRILASAGLKRINNHKKRPGIKALLDIVKHKGQDLTLSDLMFKVAPRINAAGRMKLAIQAVRLLIESDLEQARSFANEIEAYNTDRKNKDAKITQEALEQIAENKEENRYTTVVYKEDWHPGVLGIVASRLIETHYKPSIVFGKGEEYLSASARSVKDFNIYNAINECSDLLVKFGGHKYAAGLSLLPENYDAFKERFEAIVKRDIKEEHRIPQLKIDAEIELKDLEQDSDKSPFPKLFRIIKRMQPFGPQNSKPVFASYNVTDQGCKLVGEDKSHLRIAVKDASTDKVYYGIGFGMADKFTKLNKKEFDIAYTLEENHFNGRVSLQLFIKDIR